MKRGSFILAAISMLPVTAFSKTIISIMTRTDKGFKVPSGDTRFGEHLKMKGVTSNVLDLKISAKDTDGALTVFEQNGFTPKGGPPLHLHLYQDEVFYIIEGDYLFQVGDDKYQMKPGDTIFLPREVPHSFAQLTDSGKVIVSYMPSGKMEAFFKATDKWISPPSNEEIEKVFKDHDLIVVGPPLIVE